jgi:hypothetical protein
MGGVLRICQQIPCGSQFYYKNRETIRAFFLKQHGRIGVLCRYAVVLGEGEALLRSIVERLG